MSKTNELKYQKKVSKDIHRLHKTPSILMSLYTQIFLFSANLVNKSYITPKHANAIYVNILKKF